jgi:uncharacterized protein involved in high-affinity Fe2+ transport
MRLTWLILFLGLAWSGFSKASEMVLGSVSLKPGIELTFEVAIKDDVTPKIIFSSESLSDIHLEVLATWGEKAPRGAIEGGFVPYLEIIATLTNQESGETLLIPLTPHLNMSDNFHYAQNTKLPGGSDNLYTLGITVQNSRRTTLGLHLDWRNEVGEGLVASSHFTFQNLDFSDIVAASRR